MKEGKEGGHKSKVKRVVKFPEWNNGPLNKQRVLLGRSNFNISIKVLKGGGKKIKCEFTVFDRKDSYLLFLTVLTIFLMLNTF